MQFTIVRWFALVLIAALASPGFASSDATVVSSGADVPIVPQLNPPHTDREQQVIALADRIFEDAGLTIPDVEIRFHMGLERCFGNTGLYRDFADRIPIVDVCANPDSQTDPDIQQTRTLWHELAHAHLEPLLSIEQKEAFVTLLGLDAWESGDWHARGSEYAAEILVWGITGGSYRLHAALSSLDCTTLNAALSIISQVEHHEC